MTCALIALLIAASEPLDAKPGRSSATDMPARPQLPRSVVLFLRTHVDHVEKLRFIVLLHESPSAMTSGQTAARMLDIPRAQIRDMAKELEHDGLVRVTGDLFELAPASIDDRLAIADVADWYARHRTVILDALRALGRD